MLISFLTFAISFTLMAKKELQGLTSRYVELLCKDVTRFFTRPFVILWYAIKLTIFIIYQTLQSGSFLGFNALWQGLGCDHSEHVLIISFLLSPSI